MVANAGAIALGVIGMVCILIAVMAGGTLVQGESDYVDWFLALVAIVSVALGLTCFRRAVAAFRARL